MIKLKAFPIIVFITVFSGMRYHKNVLSVASSEPKRQVYVNDLIKAKVPDGNEIKVEIATSQNKRAILSLTNLSSEIIYIPFLINSNGGWATLGCEGLEKFDSISNSFTDITCSIAGLYYYRNYLVELGENNPTLIGAVFRKSRQ